MSASPIRDFEISNHAALQMSRRGISLAELEAVLDSPDQRWQVRTDRDVLQARLRRDPTGKEYLARVFVDVNRVPPVVVTAYFTSNIGK